MSRGGKIDRSAGATVGRFRAARRDPAHCVLEGLHALKHARRFGAEILEIIARDLDEVAALSERLAPDLTDTIRTRAREFSAEDYARLSPLSHPTGVMAIASRRAWNAETILSPTESRPVIILDHPIHLGNIGAAIRVAAAVDAAGVICRGRHDPWSPEAVRAGAGLQFAVGAARVDEVPPLQRPLVALDAEAPSLLDTPLPAAPVFAFGSERAGLSEDLLCRAEIRVSLPMRTGVSSLNLATAVAAAMYAWRALNRG